MIDTQNTTNGVDRSSWGAPEWSSKGKGEERPQACSLGTWRKSASGRV